MPGKPPGWIVTGILEGLAEEGPMTRAQLCRYLEADRTEVGSVVSRLNKQLPTRPKRIYIVRYTREDDVSKIAYPRAVYALGDLPDAPKPRRQAHKIVAKRYRQRAKLKVSSVFEFGMSRRQREQYRREVRERAAEVAARRAA